MEYWNIRKLVDKIRRDMNLWVLLAVEFSFGENRIIDKFSEINLKKFTWNK